MNKAKKKVNERNEDATTSAADASAAIGIDLMCTGHPADLALSLENMSFAESLTALLALPLPRRVDTFGFLRLEFQSQLARRMDHGDLVSIVTGMSADDRADLFNCMTLEEQLRLLPDLAHDEREDVRLLAGHAETTAGAIMTSDYATLGAEMTTVEAIEALRRQTPGKETIYRSYVLNEARHLIGSIRLHALILATEDARVEDLMERSPISVTLDMDQETVARMIERYDVLALPVIDSDDRLVGIVTHDDAADAMQQEMTEDFHKLGTVGPLTTGLRDTTLRVL